MGAGLVGLTRWIIGVWYDFWLFEMIPLLCNIRIELGSQ